MRYERKIINLYKETNLYNIKQVISIATEDDLNEFWSYLNSSENSAHQLIDTFITQFYNFALIYIMKEDSEFFEIIFEENKQYFYFTIWNKKISLLFAKHIEKTNLEYITSKNRITIKLNKKKFTKQQQQILRGNKHRENNLISSISHEHVKEVILPYSFINEDDLDDLLKLNDDLQELVFLAQKNGPNTNLFISFRSTLSLFCLTLRYYDEISLMAKTLTEFSNLLNTQQDKFMSLNNNELELIYGFVYNIDKWLQSLFVTGGAHLYFMDKSIQSDLTTIEHIINNSEDTQEYDLEDIFNF